PAALQKSPFEVAEERRRQALEVCLAEPDGVADAELQDRLLGGELDLPVSTQDTAVRDQGVDDEPDFVERVAVLALIVGPWEPMHEVAVHDHGQVIKEQGLKGLDSGFDVLSRRTAANSPG